MASFSGTQTRCKACDKTVYLVDQLVADGLVFHKACFRCHHCNSTLKIGSYSAIEGVLYCKPHFEQLFKQTGSYNKSFDDAIKEEAANAPKPETVMDTSVVGKPKGGQTEKKPLTALQKRFMGTQDKCHACQKTVYPLEKVSVENNPFHKACFKCVHCSGSLSLASYAALEGKLYCKPHYQQLFTEKGNYTNLLNKKPVAATAGDGAPK